MLDIVVTGRRVEVPARFRTYVQEKLAKVEKIKPKVIRVDVEVSRERNPRLSAISDRVELTCVSKGPIIRAEASADTMMAAFDLAWVKLEVRLRKSVDRRRVHRRSRPPVLVGDGAAPLAASTAGEPGASLGGPPSPMPTISPKEPAARVDRGVDGDIDTDVDPYDGTVEQQGDGPMLVREKLHRTAPMNLDQALYEMELVGHDFFLFCDKESGLPSVVYRRRGYDYGVIRIDTETATEPGDLQHNGG